MLQFLTTTFAVVLGAAIAYVSHRLLEGSRDRDAYLAATLQAQFTLVVHRNYLEVLVRHLNEFRDDQDRHLMLFHLSHDLERPRLDAQGLGFMLRSQNPDLLNELMVCDSRFALVLGTTSDRNKFLDDRVLDYLGQHYECITQPDPKDWRLLRLKTYTDNVYSAADDALETNKDCFEKLRQFIKAEFPKARPLVARVPEKATASGDAVR